MQAFQGALEAAAEATGLMLRRLDRKGEKAALAEQRRTWEAELDATTDPPTALALALPLLFLQACPRVVISTAGVRENSQEGFMVWPLYMS